jgi:ABC-type phosphate/phosphonate transport system substrate-binding protein
MERTLRIALGIASIIACGLAASPAAARAGEKDFVIYAPGMGASASQAKPYLDKFGALLEKQMGWKPGSANLTYLDDPKAVSDYIEQQKPAFGLLPPADFLDLSCRKVALQPLAAVVLLSSASSSSSGRWHVVVKDGTAKNLEGLKGKKLGSNHLQDPRYVSRVVFGGKFDAAKDFVLKPTNSPITPFKWVDRGEAEAALVDDAQLAHMKTLPFAKSLVVVFSSEELPPAPIVAFEKAARPADRAALRKAVTAMCSTADGEPICKEMQVTRFQPVDAKTYAAASQLYCGK